MINRVVFILILLLSSTPWFGAAVGDGSEASTGALPCESQIVFLKDQLRSVFRSQLASGALNVGGEDAWLEDYPILATLCREAYLLDRDRVFLQQAYTSIARYFNYLFIERDADGDFLIESPDWNIDERLQERVSFNALLSLDMENLARICLELGVPLRGLFWYDGIRMIRECIIETCYDADANAFFSVDPNTHAKHRRDNAFSLLPTLFPDGLGDNLSTSMLRYYISKVYPSGSHPGKDTLQEDSKGFGASNNQSERLLETILVQEIYEQNGLVSEAKRYRKEYSIDRPPPDDASRKLHGEGIYSDFFSCRLAQSEPKLLFPSLLELELLFKIACTQHIISENEIAIFKRSIDRMHQFLSAYRSLITHDDFSENQIDNEVALAAVRHAYQIISVVNDRRKQGTVFSQRDRSDIPGFDLDGALTRLIQNAIQALHRVETAIFNSQGTDKGFRILTTLLKERAVVGETIPLKMSVSVNRAPESIQSILLFGKTAIDTIFTVPTPVEITPGGKPLTAFHHYTIPSNWLPGIHTISFAVKVRLGNGEYRQSHFRKSVYIDPPLVFRVAYPEGRILKDWGVPLEIHLMKRAPYPMSVQTGWYSPSGLKLREGKSQELYMPKGESSVFVKLHVLAPNPIRPGAFPFILKIFGNNLDVGTISSTLFKHYQWIFTGPFPIEEGQSISKAYPPEHRINLLDVFDGINGRIFWGVLPTYALTDNGEISIGRLFSPSGIGYLYTVIKSAHAVSCPAFLSGTAPAKLFINGRPVLELQENSSSLPAHKTVQLKEGLNNILIKVYGVKKATIFFNLGDDDSITSDEFNNNLWELVDGFKDFHESRILQFAETSATQKIATIRYYSSEANSVSVIGTFNGWSPESSPLRKVSDGVWEISLHLPPGKYAYRFLVNNNRQLLDPLCQIQEPDGYGGHNSVLYVK